VVSLIELDVGVAAIIALVIVQLSITSIFVSVQSSTSMLEYAKAQQERIVFSDEVINRYGLYDEECRSVVPQTLGDVPDGLKFNVSLRELGEESEAEGIIVRRLVFVGEQDVRVLEVW